ncbi:MAG: hemerythrin domain-containing protein [Acidiferrobacteraceae bacterium]
MSLSCLIDFRECPSGPSAYEHACVELSALANDDHIALFVDENPRFLLRRLEHVLGRALYACIERQHILLWYVEVACTSDALRPRQLSEIMSRDHVRLYRMFVEAEQLLRHRRDAGLPMMARFATQMCRHIYTESQILAPLLSCDLLEDAGGPVATMRRDHLKIAHALSDLTDLLATPPVPAGSLNPLIRLFSALLSGHETREETLIFPLWDSALRQRHDAPAILDMVETELRPAILRRSH